MYGTEQKPSNSVKIPLTTETTEPGIKQINRRVKIHIAFLLVILTLSIVKCTMTCTNGIERKNLPRRS